MDNDTNRSCTYCAQVVQVDGDDYLECIECHGDVHIKCLRLASTPGDLLGDVFFDLTCANCMELQHDEPTSSTKSQAIREKFARQRLPWLMVITLAIYNLSIKSKGLGRNGYFHWRSHITSFISKNWEYLFESSRRRRKNWIGSVSGALSHNNPEFFLSGLDEFNESGWWKLTHSNQTPKIIYRIYEQQCQKRVQQRNDKRQQEESDHSVSVGTEAKRLRRRDSDDEPVTPTDSCSRTTPYMGRKPKVTKPLEIIEDEINKQLHQQPLNTVQSSLMDFLAENLSNDDFSMFNHLPSIAPEALVDGTGGAVVDKHDYLSLPDTHSENASFFDVPELMNNGSSHNQSNAMPTTISAGAADGKLRRFYQQHDEPRKPAIEHVGESLPHADAQEFSLHKSPKTTAASDDDDGDGDEDDEYQPRIVQVTNFQQLDVVEDGRHKAEAGDVIKEEPQSDGEHIGTLDVTKQRSATVNDTEVKITPNSLTICKGSLFTKQSRRNWPWLVQMDSDEEEAQQQQVDNENERNIVPMSEYEERELLQKMQRIFALEVKCQLKIPAYIRRFYRKLCIRAWKREHGKPLFNLDEHLTGRGHPLTHNDNTRTQIIDRYQLIAASTQSTRTSFYARIAGSFQYELFESPYTMRILHPFIYRNTKCFPPWLKLMCELQYAVSGVVPKRASVDFCYVRPNHIGAVNALLQTVFWPGIDMSECLSYPDYSVVALYKKLVVGCAFLVPDVSYNEAYISFMAVRPGWQRSGIATFMLYHLIQTCMAKDITLHVSASNPAVVLYQKFGFKIEEIILNFYEKYLPLDSKHSRNAFFLRLMR